MHVDPRTRQHRRGGRWIGNLVARARAGQVRYCCRCCHVLPLFVGFRIVYRYSTNGQNMHSGNQNNCESLWGTHAQVGWQVTAIVRLIGEQGSSLAAKAVRSSPFALDIPPNEPSRPYPLRDIPKRSPLHTLKTPYPLHDIPIKSPGDAHIPSIHRT